MKRNINIVNQHCHTSIANTDNYNVSNLSSIIDYSVDNMFCMCLDTYSKEELLGLLPDLLKKLRPSGCLVVRITDFKAVCKRYIDNQISNDEFMKLLSTKKSSLSIDEIITALDMNLFKIIKTHREDLLLSVTIQRISV